MKVRHASKVDQPQKCQARRQLFPPDSIRRETTVGSKSAKTTTKSNCPLVADPQLRSAADAQTDAIKANFPSGIGRPALRTLVAAGFTSMERMADASEREIADLHGMGPKALGILRTELQRMGLKFRN